MLVLPLPLVAPAQVLGQELEQQQPPHQHQLLQVLQIPQSHPVTQTRLQPLPRPPRKQ